MLNRLILSICMMLLLAACATQAVTPGKVEYQIVMERSHCPVGSGKGQTFLFLNEEHWSAAHNRPGYARIVEQAGPMRDDHARVVVLAEQQNHGGFRLGVMHARVQQLKENEGILQLTMRLFGPATGSVSTMMLSRPCMVLDIPLDQLNSVSRVNTLWH
ncbi:MAG: hypothetical protein R3183_07955 [Oleiphilaceae bacterium]|nr:hypothetical protein [Oleiphilaceae bacterium]